MINTYKFRILRSFEAKPLKIISKGEFKSFVNNLINKDPREVIGVQSKDEKFVFDKLNSAEDLRLDYDVTILPPKKYFMPQKETVLKYNLFDGNFDINPVKELPCVPK